MKKSALISAHAEAAKPAATKVTAEIVRTCGREGCERSLKKSQKQFCSRVCTAIAHGKLGNEAHRKYEPRFAKEVMKAYFERCDKGNDPTLVPTKTGYITIPNAIIPTKEDFVEYLFDEHGVDIHETTLDNWVKQYPEFAIAMDRLIRRQRNALINHGLSGRYNAHQARLILSVNHNVKEEKEVDRSEIYAFGIVKHVYESADRIEPPKTP